MSAAEQPQFEEVDSGGAGFRVPNIMTKTVRSRFDHEVGGEVQGCKILEKRVVIPPEPRERRLGVYDYLVEVPPAAVAEPKARSSRKESSTSSRPSRPDPGSFTRSTPEEMGGRVIRRVPSR